MTKKIDICLLLEGTYPYVRGGVSSWLHQIISGLPQYHFHLIFLGGSPEFYGEPVYELPDNVVGFEAHYLLHTPDKLTPTARKGDSDMFEKWGQLVAYLEQAKEPIPDELLDAVFSKLGNNNSLSLADFLYSRSSWEVLSKRYRDISPHKSFVDYFWTYRNIHQPLFTLAHIAENLPDAKVFHSLSTGYAGFLGALCKQKTKRPYILTEHGIYTKERKIDLSQASWIEDRHSLIDISMHKEMDQTRKTWVRFFEQLGLTAYHKADKIISLFEGNRQRQHADGAPEYKTQVITNGIDVARFEETYAQRPVTPPLVVGLIGRVVPIKDIKTFIRAIRGAVEVMPTLQGWIIGPTEEDPSYARECELLIDSLGLTEHVKLLGNQNVAEMMPKLGVVMLTSISEAQPLVLLEAMASGIPCIATEVGACREIIHGAPGEDASMGAAGSIIQIASPVQAAHAIIDTLTNTSQWHKTGDIGKQRVTRYYNETDMHHVYRTLYQEAIDGGNRF
ncbi:GT4 family glycosyltransferase PelF [Oceanisphaera sp. IT1-181]|uniref:GT4 family glycosyltransferase PelF n=1 Tax=Oceanisphaera sp. IT1-181 TaxID=3081199 RepID=UPI0029CA28B5|nr:GT4 family glycosyltransferase PelF [Oceanisphaera sp. IT1-181]